MKDIESAGKHLSGKWILNLVKHRPSMDHWNRVCMGAVMGGGPVIGSAVSFLMSGAFIWAILRLLHRDFALVRIREITIVAAVFAAFVLVRVVAELLAFAGAATFQEILMILPFLSILPIYSRLGISMREDIRNAIEIGAVITAFPAFGWASMEVLILGMPRAEGGAGNAGPFATVSLVVYVICLLAASRHRGARQFWALAAAVLSAAAVLLSGMRSLWPGIVLAPLAISCVIAQDVDWRRIRKAMAVGLALLVVITLLLSETIMDRILVLEQDYQRLLEANEYQTSLGYRIMMLDSGWDLFVEAPLFGHGARNLPALLTQQTLENYGEDVGFSHFHNAFLTEAVQSGIVGVIALAMLLIVPLVLAFRHAKDEIGRYGLALLVSVYGIYLLSGLFNVMLGHDILDFTFIASTITGLFLVFGRGRQQSFESEPRPIAGLAQQLSSRADD